MQWQRYCHANDSIITRALYGQTTSSFTCPHCGFVQRSWDPWLGLHVNIPASGQESLLTLLNESFNTLQETDGYRCDQCRQEGARRLDKISRCPEILIIVLARNIYRKDGSQGKKDTVVRFPLDNLSLDPYFISLDGLGSENLDDGFLAPFIYDCYAVLQHVGPGSKSGHYWALVKETDHRNGKDVWIRYNDREIKIIKDIQSESQNERSYVLFYQRRKN
jgi:ubiquitin carboxyl-terminal hydrolase 8